MPTMPARIIHISIDRDWRDVARFVLAPENMPQWASGLGAGFEPRGDHWVADGGPIGEVRIDFAPDNAFGFADHDVTLPDGTVIQNALRVAPNGDGAEVMFTLLRQPSMSDADYEADAAHIRKDLETLKSVLEA
ncbi:SRPBCC family protein [Rhizobium sp.]